MIELFMAVFGSGFAIALCGCARSYPIRDRWPGWVAPTILVGWCVAMALDYVWSVGVMPLALPMVLIAFLYAVFVSDRDEAKALDRKL